MLGNPDFSFRQLRKYVVVFGNVFNDMYITRLDSTGNDLKRIKVPITYAGKDKVLVRPEQDPVVQPGRQTQITLPAMSFEITSLTYDNARKRQTMISSNVRGTDGDSLSQYTPVPYNIGFNLYVYVKNEEDGTKIIEQILPFFTPDWTPTIDLIPEMNVTNVDVPIVLNSVQRQDDDMGAYATTRKLIWTLGFVMKGLFYGPIRSAKLIKFANVSFYIAKTENMIDAVGNTAAVARITTQPGLLANGSPTSNAALTIGYTEINIDDDFGFVVVETDPIL